MAKKEPIRVTLGLLIGRPLSNNILIGIVKNSSFMLVGSKFSHAQLLLEIEIHLSYFYPAGK